MFTGSLLPLCPICPLCLLHHCVPVSGNLLTASSEFTQDIYSTYVFIWFVLWLRPLCPWWNLLSELTEEIYSVNFLSEEIYSVNLVRKSQEIYSVNLLCEFTQWTYWGNLLTVSTVHAVCKFTLWIYYHYFTVFTGYCFHCVHYVHCVYCVHCVPVSTASSEFIQDIYSTYLYLICSVNLLMKFTQWTYWGNLLSEFSQ